MLPRDQASPFDSAKTTGCGQKNQLRRGGNVLKIASFSLPVALGAALVILFLIALTFSDLPGTYAYLTAQDQLGAAVFTVAIPPPVVTVTGLTISPNNFNRQNNADDLISVMSFSGDHGYRSATPANVEFQYRAINGTVRRVAAYHTAINTSTYALTARFNAAEVNAIVPGGNNTITVYVVWSVDGKVYTGSTTITVKGPLWPGL